MIVGYDADSLPPVEGGHEIVYDKAVEPGTDKADDDKSERVDCERRAADDRSGDRNRKAYIEVQVLIDYLRKDVKSSGGGVDVEEDCLGYTEKQYKAYKVKPRVAHYGRDAARAHGNNLFRRADHFPKVHQRTEYHGRIDGLGPEFLSDKKPCHDKEHCIREGHYHGDFDIDSGFCEKCGNDDGEARNRADDKFARNEEIVDGGSSYHHTEGHDEEFLPELPGSENFENVIHYAVILVISYAVPRRSHRQGTEFPARAFRRTGKTLLNYSFNLYLSPSRQAFTSDSICSRL